MNIKGTGEGTGTVARLKFRENYILKFAIHSCCRYTNTFNRRTLLVWPFDIIYHSLVLAETNIIITAKQKQKNTTKKNTETMDPPFPPEAYVWKVWRFYILNEYQRELRRDVRKARGFKRIEIFKRNPSLSCRKTYD